MKDLIKGLFSHTDGGSHRDSGLDNLLEIMEDRTFAEADCGA